MNTMDYQVFKKTAEKFNYLEDSIKQTYQRICNMDERIFDSFAKWINTQEYPCISIENIDIPFLTEYCKLNPINAFLTMDWLLREPETAKYALQQRVFPMSPLTDGEKESLNRLKVFGHS